MLVTIPLTIGLLGGFWIGVWVGIGQHILIESSVKASLLSGELRALRSNDKEKLGHLIDAKEMELDGQILMFSRYEEEGMPWILWPFNTIYEHDRTMRSASLYRKEYPSPGTLSDDATMKEVAAVVKDVTDRYPTQPTK